MHEKEPQKPPEHTSEHVKSWARDPNPTTDSQSDNSVLTVDLCNHLTSYRGISLEATISKVFERVLINIIAPLQSCCKDSIEDSSQV